MNTANDSATVEVAPSVTASGLKIEAVRPQDLSHSDFVRLNEVSQDMWASEAGLGELVQCRYCDEMYSKEDIFGHLPPDVTQHTVSEIMESLWMEHIPCRLCGGETRFIYGAENVEGIKKRTLESVNSFLVLCTDKHGEIVGFNDGYIDSFDTIFDQEFAYHYRDIWVREVKSRVARILGYIPHQMLAVSSIGLLQQYRNFPNLLEMLNQFARSIPDEYMGMPGIAELDKGWVVYRMCEAIKIGSCTDILQDPQLAAKITDIGKSYNSELMVYPDIVRGMKDGFTHGQRHFLKISRPQRGTIARKPQPAPAHEHDMKELQAA